MKLPRVWIAKDNFDAEGKPYQDRIRVYKENPSMPGIPCFFSEPEVEELLRAEREKALAEVIAEATRKKAMIDKPEPGHSAQSFGQSWAYGEVIDWAKAARKGDAKEREETESFPGQSKLNLIDELWAAAADEHYCRTIRNFLDKFRKDNLLSSRESAPGEEKE